MNARCPGCGARFQHDEPDRPGYLPPELAETDGARFAAGAIVSRHYGRAEGRPLAPAEARRWIGKALDAADAVLVVTEIGDFEGSLPPPGLLPADKPVILVINKIDLLPPKAVTAGDKGMGTRPLARRRAWPAGQRRGGGQRGAGDGTAEHLFPVMRKLGGPRRALAVIGATSVGKSTLLRRLLAGAGAVPSPTVSRFPGTTQAAMSWRLERDGLTIYDTPGFLPGDRLTDLLCPDCAAQLVTEHALTSKLFGLEPGQALVFGGFAAFVLQGTEPRTFLAYAGDHVVLHRTGAEKAEELLNDPAGLASALGLRQVPAVPDSAGTGGRPGGQRGPGRGRPRLDLLARRTGPDPRRLAARRPAGAPAGHVRQAFGAAAAGRIRPRTAEMKIAALAIYSPRTSLGGMIVMERLYVIDFQRARSGGAKSSARCGRPWARPNARRAATAV